jgi:hypothetical protein
MCGGKVRVRGQFNMDEVRELLVKFNRNIGATDAQIADNERELGKKLPAEYVEFLKLSNGGEGFVGKHYLILWPVEELSEANKGYEVEESAPGLLAFGSDGGGEAFGFDTRIPDWPVVLVPFIVMDWDDAIPVVDSFGGFFKRLFENESLFPSKEL